MQKTQATRNSEEGFCSGAFPGLIRHAILLSARDNASPNQLPKALAK